MPPQAGRPANESLTWKKIASQAIGRRRPATTSCCGEHLADQLAHSKRAMQIRVAQRKSAATAFVASTRTTEISLSRHWQHDVMATANHAAHVKRNHFFAIVKFHTPASFSANPYGNHRTYYVPVARRAIVIIPDSIFLRISADNLLIQSRTPNRFFRCAPFICDYTQPRDRRGRPA
jgi:hypothetical protein